MRAVLLGALLCAGVYVTAKTIPPRKLAGPNKQNGLPALIDADLEALVSGLQSGLFNSVDLVKAYTARILEVNSTLHMVTELNPDAETIAHEADVLRAQDKVSSPLHGIPILVKNNIGTNDKMNTTSGSWSLLGAKVPRDATVATKLREAGAIILGKTNLSQWGGYRSLNTSNGWSAYGGQTYGAYYPGQDPSGSSAGSAVSSSIGLALAALGTEASGSIVSPSEFNNIVGIKPTVGLTSRHLVVPVTEHQGTVGPMARSVRDAAYLLQAIAGPDPLDNYTSANPNIGASMPQYVEACNYNALAGKRIGVAKNVLEISRGEIDASVLRAFNIAVEQIKDAGATIVDANFTAFQEWTRSSAKTEYEVVQSDLIVDLAGYFAELSYNPLGLESLAQELEFTHSYPAEEWPYRDTGLWQSALDRAWNNTSPEFWDAYSKNLFYGGEGGILGAVQRNNVTAVLLPTHLSYPIPALVGSPVITVPMGFYPANVTVSMNGNGDLVETAPNIPFGLSFMGPKWSEAELIGLAYAYEQRTMHRNDVQPYLVPEFELADVIASS